MGRLHLAELILKDGNRGESVAQRGIKTAEEGSKRKNSLTSWSLLAKKSKKVRLESQRFETEKGMNHIPRST